MKSRMEVSDHCFFCGCNILFIFLYILTLSTKRWWWCCNIQFWSLFLKQVSQMLISVMHLPLYVMLEWQLIYHIVLLSCLCLLWLFLPISPSYYSVISDCRPQAESWSERESGWCCTGALRALIWSPNSKDVESTCSRSYVKSVLELRLYPTAVILEPKKIKSDTVSTVSPSICHEVMGPDAMILVF